MECVLKGDGVVKGPTVDTLEINDSRPNTITDRYRVHGQSYYKRNGQSSTHSVRV